MDDHGSGVRLPSGLHAAEIILKKGWISRAQFDECITERNKVAESGSETRPDLWRILIQKGYVSGGQVAEALREEAAASFSKLKIPGYQILSKIGEGGMGVVYKARHVSLHREVALKVLLPQFVRSEEYVQRFLREAQAAAALEHENVVRTYDAGHVETDEGAVDYFTMEFVHGETLAEKLKARKRIPEDEATRYVAQTARALEYANRHGIVHRDIKPENLMVTPEGTVKVMDLGLAKVSGEETNRLTEAGIAVGSPAYMSPEQARAANDIDIRADIYSLGATFYHLVTGEVPFTGENSSVILYQHIHAQPPWPRTKNHDLSTHICRVILKMMAKDRAWRYHTPTELLQALEHQSAPPPAAAPPPPVPAAAAPATRAPEPIQKLEPTPVESVELWFERNRRRLLGAALILALALAVILFLPLKERLVQLGVTAGGTMVLLAYLVLAMPAKKARRLLSAPREPEAFAPMADEVPGFWEDGMIAEYSSGRTLKIRRVDREIHLTKDSSPPTEPAGLAARWSGYLYAPVTGPYLFRYAGSGSLRVLIWGREAWRVDGPSAAAVHHTIRLREGVYGLVVEFSHFRGPLEASFAADAAGSPGTEPGPAPRLCHDPGGFEPFVA